MSDESARTVTFLFTDIERSTRLWERHPQAMRPTLAAHDALMREVFAAHGGHVFKAVGDGFYVAFSRPDNALSAAVVVQRAILLHPWEATTPLRVRVAIASGDVELRDDDYFGVTLSRIARLRDAAHGGQILVAQSTLDLSAGLLPEAIQLIPLGAYSLRDLQRPETIYQLVHPDLPNSFPPLRSLEAFTHNLPLQLTSFIGRETEIAAGKELLRTTRLLTLTGAGGCGKTRLALQIAAEMLDEFEHGAWLLELAAIRDPALVPSALASVLTIPEEAGSPPLEAILRALRGKQLLLLIDNCEHLIHICAHLTDALLRHCPDIRILTTSREPLDIGGETTRRVPSLKVPDGLASVEQMLQCDAAQLFLERARAARPEFMLTSENAQHIAAICQRLDGIPLALELAARRVKMMSVEETAHQLDDSFQLLTGGSRIALPRQQTLRALIDWSYNLLDTKEKTLLARLSVFSGGWTLNAVESICSDLTSEAEEAVQQPEVLEVLVRLVDKSLVLYEEEQDSQGRYRLLEILRQYGAEKRHTAPGADLWVERHADWFLDYAERAEPLLTGPEQANWLTCLEKEHDNFRVALQNLPPGERRLRLATALWRFWFVRGHLSEGRRSLEEALQVGAEVPVVLRARAWNAAGVFAMTQGDSEAAQAFYLLSLQLYQEIEDEQGTANALNNLALIAHRSGDYPTMQARLEACLPIYRRLNVPALVGVVLNNLGVAMLLQDDLDNAFECLNESQELARQLGNKSNRAEALHNLGEVNRKRRNFDGAQRCYMESLIIRRELENASGMARSLLDLGLIAEAQGRPQKAVPLLAAAEAARQSLGEPLPTYDQQEQQSRIENLKALLSHEQFVEAWNAGRRMSLEQATEFALQTDV